MHISIQANIAVQCTLGSPEKHKRIFFRNHQGLNWLTERTYRFQIMFFLFKCRFPWRQVSHAWFQELSKINWNVLKFINFSQLVSWFAVFGFFYNFYADLTALTVTIFRNKSRKLLLVSFIFKITEIDHFILIFSIVIYFGISILCKHF